MGSLDQDLAKAVEARRTAPDTTSFVRARARERVLRRRLAESKETAALSVTPNPFSTSTTSNWVARTGGLPPYIQNVAKALVRGGQDESSAIATAIGTVKRWAAGGGGVHPEVKAAAAAALAQWEAKRGAAHAQSAAKEATKSAAK
jgi:hypothetical protein